MKFWCNIQVELGLKTEDIDGCNISIWEKNFVINKDSFLERSRNFPGEANFYTDGSKMSDNIGAAFVLYEVNRLVKTEKFKLPATCTVFQAEIKAILEAAKYLNTTSKYKYVKFFIDSQAAILALESVKITSTLVREAKLELNKAATNRIIILNWTRVHRLSLIHI